MNSMKNILTKANITNILENGNYSQKGKYLLIGGRQIQTQRVYSLEVGLCAWGGKGVQLNESEKRWEAMLLLDALQDHIDSVINVLMVMRIGVLLFS